MSKNTKIILAIVAAGGVMVIGFVAIFLVFSGLLPNSEITEEERAMLITIDDVVADIPEFTPKPGAESLSKSGVSGFITSLDYEYDEPDNDDAPFISASVYTESSVREAQSSYALEKTILEAGMEALGVDVVVHSANNIYSCCERSDFGVIYSGGVPVGNLFMAREGRHYVSVLIIGWYVDTPDETAAFFGPRMKLLVEYD